MAPQSLAISFRLQVRSKDPTMLGWQATDCTWQGLICPGAQELRKCSRVSLQYADDL